MKKYFITALYRFATFESKIHRLEKIFGIDVTELVRWDIS